MVFHCFCLCLVFELFKNQRFFSSEIEVTLEHFCSAGKTFSTFFWVCLFLIRLTTDKKRFSSILYSLSSFTLFSFQGAISRVSRGFWLDFSFPDLIRGKAGVPPVVHTADSASQNRLLFATDCGFAAKVAVVAFLRCTVRVFLLCKNTLVEMRRIELLTPCLQGRCSPS